MLITVLVFDTYPSKATASTNQRSKRLTTPQTTRRRNKIKPTRRNSRKNKPSNKEGTKRNKSKERKRIHKEARKRKTKFTALLPPVQGWLMLFDPVHEIC